MKPVYDMKLLAPVRRWLLVVTLWVVGSGAFGLLAQRAVASETSTQVTTDLLIVGATESGWAAAIQAARMGTKSITIVHDGRWFGGQFTEQALACVDENKGVGKVGWGVDWHPMKRSFHRSGLFQELMDRIEAFNESKYGDTMPGRPFHGPSTYRPVEAEAIFRELIQPFIDNGQVRVWWNRYPVRAEVEVTKTRPRLTGLSFAPVGSESPDLHVTARMTIDASDWGEAIQVSGAAFECGPDPQSRYGEPSAPADLSNNPANEMNPITWAMIVEESDQETPIVKPNRFDDRNFVRTSRISLGVMQDLDWDRPVKLGSIPHWPDAGKESPRQLSIYTVRRLVDGNTSPEAKTLILLNYMLGQDYPLERLPAEVISALEEDEPGASRKNIVRMTRDQRQIIFDDAKRHSLSMLYHLQHFVHDRASDRANSFRRFHLSDEFGTPDRLPPKPYIREALRLKAMYMMREQDGRNADGRTKDAAKERFARVLYPDGLFCWQFHYDFHRTGRAYLRGEGGEGPWVDFEKPGRHTHHASDRSLFPLRSLVPEKMDGLLGAQKNVGYTSVVCAAIRLHDQCIAIGQAAGATAAISLASDVDAREIPYDRERLEQVRAGLCGPAGDSVPLLLWPYRDLSPEHPAFVAINRLAAMGIQANGDYEVDFRPQAPASEPWQTQMIALVTAAAVDDVDLKPISGRSRAEFCKMLWSKLKSARLRPFKRIAKNDADGDRILDPDDPTLFTAGEPVVWEIEPPGPTEDGVPPSFERTGDNRRFNFSVKGAKTLDSYITDFGDAATETNAFGWSLSNVANSRRRGVFPEQARDSFAFTRETATWECRLPSGQWKVTVCVGDATHPQPGQSVSVEGVSAVSNVNTDAGRFHEATVQVRVTDGNLTVVLGPQDPGHNTCLNWIQIER